MNVLDTPTTLHLPPLRVSRAMAAGSDAPVVSSDREHRVADVATLVFFFLFYVNGAVILSKFHGVPPTLAWSFTALLAIPLAHHVLAERQPLAITPVLPLVLAFLAALFFSALISGEPGITKQALGPYLTEGLFLFLLVSNAVRSPRTLTRVVWVLLLAGSVLGAFSIFQELTHSYANEIGGFAQVDRLDQGGGFNVASDNLGPKELRPRLGGPLGSENRYAQILAVLLPLALLRVWREPLIRNRLLAGGAGILILGGLLLTFSRGAAVALTLVLIAMALFRAIRLRHLLAIVVAAAVVVVVAVPDYVIRLDSLQGITSLSSDQPSTGADNALRGRQTENLAAFYTFVDHPIAGVGPGVYFREYSRQNANELGLRYLDSERRAHSLYLELLADAGLLGLSLFLALLGTTLVCLHRAARYWRGRRPEYELLALSFFYSLLAYMGTALFLHLSYQRYFWVLVALSSSVIWALRREARREEAKADLRRAKPAP
jgi:putative inorganic carbon (HCO3(-)) transporter